MNSSTRPAQPADLDAVCAIAQSTPFSARWSRAQYEEELGSGRGLFAVVADAEARGYLVLRKVPPEAQLVDIAVRPQDQGRGLGRALLACAAQTARAWGCARITLEVSAANETALRLYRRAGFQVVGRRPKFYNDRSDAILMDLILA
ncbi:MAG: ribosomal protein S18-alanine N-acetyltransferase [Elusimicrobia bacterium]|nr:ribosomal protein S18-alanine N-acetyltransferase [Elusimicrobiota bacterium]